MVGSDRNADAGFDGQQMTVDVERLADDLKKLLRQFDGAVRAGVAKLLQDGKFVAPEPGHKVVGPDAGPQPRRRLDQQGVAHGMAERVVHLLEVIEVEKVHGECLVVCPIVFRRGIDVFEEPHAIGEVGQGVVVRQMGDLFFGPFLRRDVLMDGDRAAVGHGLMADRNHPPVLQLVDDVAGRRQERFRETIREIFFRILRAAADRYACLDNVRQRDPGPRLLRVETVHRTVQRVGDFQLVVGAVHANAVRDVCNGRLEQHVGVLEALFVRLPRHAAAHAEHRHGKNQDRKKRGDEIADASLAIERREDFARRLGDGNDQRIARDPSKHDEPLYVIAQNAVDVVPAGGRIRISRENIALG